MAESRYTTKFSENVAISHFVCVHKMLLMLLQYNVKIVHVHETLVGKRLKYFRAFCIKLAILLNFKRNNWHAIGARAPKRPKSKKKKQTGKKSKHTFAMRRRLLYFRKETKM